MEGINDLVGKPDKAINIVYGFPEIGVQQFNGRGKRCTVSNSYDPAALLAYIMKQSDGHRSTVEIFEDLF